MEGKREKVGVLIYEGENDYTLPSGSCWITVGDYSIYVVHGGGTKPAVLVEGYVHGKEMEDALASFTLEGKRFPRKAARR